MIEAMAICIFYVITIHKQSDDLAFKNEFIRKLSKLNKNE